MAQVPIIRRGPLNHALSIVEEMNKVYGGRAEGGGVPLDAAPPVSVHAGPVTMPDTGLLSPDETDRLDKEWADEEARILAGMPSRVKAPTAGVTGFMPPPQVASFPTTMPQPLFAGVNVQYIDLVNPAVVTTDGQRFEIHEAEAALIRRLAFEVMLRGISAAMVRLAETLGLLGEARGSGKESVPPMPPRASSGPVSSAPEAEGRAPVVLPGLSNILRTDTPGDAGVPTPVPPVDPGQGGEAEPQPRLQPRRRARARKSPGGPLQSVRRVRGADKNPGSVPSQEPADPVRTETSGSTDG